jgi:DnaJ family protein C protein 11
MFSLRKITLLLTTKPLKILNPANTTFTQMNFEIELEDPPNDDSLSSEENWENINYYAVLNVPKEASESEIKSAYHRLSVIFHPDKHNQSEKEGAENRFTLIKQAYDILSNPSSRAVYDLYGQNGLQSMDEWTVGPALKSKAELRAEYELHALEHKKSDMERIIKSVSGGVEISVDAAALFDSSVRTQLIEYEGDMGLLWILTPRIKSMSFNQLSEMNITDKDRLSLSGGIISRNGIGGGVFFVGLKRQINESNSINVSLATTGEISSTWERQISSDILSNVTLSSTFPSLIYLMPPAFSLSLGKSFSQKTNCFLTYHSKEWDFQPELSFPNDMMEASVHHETSKKSKISATFQLGRQNSFSLKFSYKWNPYTLLVVSADIDSTRGSFQSIESGKLNIGATRSLFSKNNSVGCFLSSETTGSIFLKIVFSRYSQKLSLPILVSESLSISATMYALACSSLCAFWLNEYLIVPSKEFKARE